MPTRRKLPSGCSGQRSKLARRQPCSVTYAPLVRFVANRNGASSPDPRGGTPEPPSADGDRYGFVFGHRESPTGPYVDSDLSHENKLELYVR